MKFLVLKGKRVESGISQLEMAKILGISKNSMNAKENSPNCGFSVDEIKVMAKHYNLTIDDVNNIFFDSEIPNGNGGRNA